jgi:signal transduction histidine kinase
VTLEVEDHGRGIASEKLAAMNEGGSGVGIRGMRDRVRHLNGEMKLESTISGTTVSISLPDVGSEPGGVEEETRLSSAV